MKMKNPKSMKKPLLNPSVLAATKNKNTFSDKSMPDSFLL